ncbi:MAG TPA: site-specific integrase, partial [Ktedonobacteraceae bacterium]|nr:site-specific integrase [Ktedonobacteraceae bacterium]
MPNQPQQPKRKKSTYGGGSVYQRKSDGRFVAKYLHPDTGKPVLRYTDTQKEAEKELENIKFEIRQGTLATGPNQKVKDYMQQWLEEIHRPQINANTYSKHRSIVYHHIIPALGHLELKKLTPQQVQKFYTDAEKVGLKKSSVRDIHKVLRNALKNAARWGMVSQNVCDKVTAPRVGRSQHTMLSVEQMQRLLQTAENHAGMEAFLKLVLTTGMRHGELLALRWDAIDFGTGILAVRHNVAHIPGQGFLVGPPKTEDGKRSTPLPQFVLSALRKHQAFQTVQRELAGATWLNNNLVFCNERGRHLYEGVSLRRFRKVLADADLPLHITMHDLRHNVA